MVDFSVNKLVKKTTYLARLIKYERANNSEIYILLKKSCQKTSESVCNNISQCWLSKREKNYVTSVAGDNKLVFSKM